MKAKYSCRFYLDKSDSDSKPIYLSITFYGQRLRLYTGHRIEPDKWEGDKVRRNTMNNEGVAFSVINADLIEWQQQVEDVMTDLVNKRILPTPANVRAGIDRKRHLVDDKPTDLMNLFEQYVQQANVSYGRIKHTKGALNILKEAGLNINDPLYVQKLILRLSEGRGHNRVVCLLKTIRSFFIQAKKDKYIQFSPFERYQIPSERYGRPVCLTKKERDKIYRAKIDNKKLDHVRNMFIFQCLIGCRVGDLLQLKQSNVVNGAIEYIPHKSRSKRSDKVRVPLSKKGLSIVNKYKDQQDGRLMTFISEQKYNEYIKELFVLLKINRIVTRINPRSGLEEQVKLSDIASSHLARRTFINVLHKSVKNEVIASMTGHIKNSRAFGRYYDIDEKTKADAIRNVLD